LAPADCWDPLPIEYEDHGTTSSSSRPRPAAPPPPPPSSSWSSSSSERAATTSASTPFHVRNLVSPYLQETGGGGQKGEQQDQHQKIAPAEASANFWEQTSATTTTTKVEQQEGIKTNCYYNYEKNFVPSNSAPRNTSTGGTSIKSPTTKQRILPSTDVVATNYPFLPRRQFFPAAGQDTTTTSSTSYDLLQFQQSPSKQHHYNDDPMISRSTASTRTGNSDNSNVMIPYSCPFQQHHHQQERSTNMQKYQTQQNDQWQKDYWEAQWSGRGRLETEQKNQELRTRGGKNTYFATVGQEGMLLLPPKKEQKQEVVWTEQRQQLNPTRPCHLSTITAYNATAPMRTNHTSFTEGRQQNARMDANAERIFFIRSVVLAIFQLLVLLLLLNLLCTGVLPSICYHSSLPLAPSSPVHHGKNEISQDIITTMMPHMIKSDTTTAQKQKIESSSTSSTSSSRSADKKKMIKRQEQEQEKQQQQGQQATNVKILQHHLDHQTYYAIDDISSGEIQIDAEATATRYSPLVHPSDQRLTTKYCFTVMNQMVPTSFEDEERRGKRSHILSGYPGIACAHCNGEKDSTAGKKVSRMKSSTTASTSYLRSGDHSPESSDSCSSTTCSKRTSSDSTSLIRDAQEVTQQQSSPGDDASASSRYGHTGRYFPYSLKNFSDHKKMLNAVYKHLVKCRNCPVSVKKQLIYFKSKHKEEMQALPRGNQATFMKQLWQRLHGQDDYECNRKSRTHRHDRAAKMG
jgi:hypothetical protein